jgi:hypothetical protein
MILPDRVCGASSALASGAGATASAPRMTRAAERAAPRASKQTRRLPHRAVTSLSRTGNQAQAPPGQARAAFYRDSVRAPDAKPHQTPSPQARPSFQNQTVLRSWSSSARATKRARKERMSATVTAAPQVLRPRSLFHSRSARISADAPGRNSTFPCASAFRISRMKWPSESGSRSLGRSFQAISFLGHSDKPATQRDPMTQRFLRTGVFLAPFHPLA